MSILDEVSCYQVGDVKLSSWVLLSFPLHIIIQHPAKKPVLITQKAKSTQHPSRAACIKRAKPAWSVWCRNTYINTGINLNLLICLSPLPQRISQPNINQRRNELKLSVLEQLAADCFRPPGLLVLKFPPWEMLFLPRVMKLLTKELVILHTRTLPGAYVQSQLQPLTLWSET